MKTTTEPSIRVQIFMAGDISEAKKEIRSYCYEVGLCVTVTPTDFIYTGGEESGFVIGLVNYPRFPDSREAEEVSQKRHTDGVTTQSKERPILFSAPMVRAILDGRKTVTRRLAKAPPNADGWVFSPERDGLWWPTHGGDYAGSGIASPYGSTGDRLWVKEAHQIFTVGASTGVAYRATCAPDGSFNYVDGAEVMNIRPSAWRPSIHMKRAWSRITLQVELVRIERLQDATLSSLRAEGMSTEDYNKCLASFTGAAYQREWWQTLWDSINGERAPYASNPWVWVVEFCRIHSSECAA